MAILDQLPGAGYPGGPNDDPNFVDQSESLASVERAWDMCDSVEEAEAGGVRLMGARLPINPAYFAGEHIRQVGGSQPFGLDDEYFLLGLAATEEIGDYGINIRHEVTLRHVLTDGSVSPVLARMVLNTAPTNNDPRSYNSEIAAALRTAVEDATQIGWFTREHTQQILELRWREQDEAALIVGLDFEPEPSERPHSWLDNWAAALAALRNQRRRV